MKVTKTCVVSMRLTPQERDALLREAARWGHSTSSFLRWILKREIERLSNQTGEHANERPSA